MLKTKINLDSFSKIDLNSGANFLKYCFLIKKAIFTVLLFFILKIIAKYIVFA